MSNEFKNHLKKSLLLIMLPLLLLLSQPAIAKEEACKKLKPINNLDELLYQFYTHLDSDCLFTLPFSELEKAWGIKILSLERTQTEPDPHTAFAELRKSSDFHGKPYQSENDGFFVKASRWSDGTSTFRIFITDAYYEEHHTLFPDGNYPKLLPEPIAAWSMYRAAHYGFPSAEYTPQNPGKYERGNEYIWLNPSRTRMIRILVGVDRSVTDIGVYSEIEPKFTDWLEEVLEDLMDTSTNK